MLDLHIITNIHSIFCPNGQGCLNNNNKLSGSIPGTYSYTLGIMSGKGSTQLREDNLVGRSFHTTSSKIEKSSHHHVSKFLQILTVGLVKC